MEKCKHDYENPIKLGRARYICSKCKKDISLELAFIWSDLTPYIDKNIK